MQMKATYIRYVMAAAMALLTCSCVEEQLEKGMPDLEGCMGVYFVEGQANIKDHTFDKGEGEASLEFIVRRANADTAATIPYTYSVYRVEQNMEEGDTAYVEVPLYDVDKFKFDKKITFAEGQRETKVKVSFDEITTGKKFVCTMSISDPRYISSYSANPSSISFSVQMNDWIKMDGEAIYRDALLTDVFDWDGTHLQNDKVEVYMRKDKNHYYRFKNVYTPEFVVRLMVGEEAFAKNKAELLKGTESYFDSKVSLELDATDSTKVYFPLQKTGFSHPTYGTLYIASEVPEVVGSGSNGLYGTRSDDGVITFPKNSLILVVAGTPLFSNRSGKARIVMPGGRSEDYEIDLESEMQNADNDIPVSFKVAKDVKKIKYRVFEGKISGIAMPDSLQIVESTGVEINVADGETEIKKAIRPAKTEAKTGIYTLVACTYGINDTNYREYSSVEFGYVKPGEERDVQIFMGLSKDDQFASDKKDENYSSENSFKYWVRGKDITHAQISYYPTSYFTTYEKDIREQMESGLYNMDAASLKMLNNGGLSGILGNQLEPGTSYTMVVYAGNGYRNQYFIEKISTNGVPDPVQKTYYASDIKAFTQPSTESYEDTWIPVSIDIFDPEAQDRAIRGNWRAKEVKLTVDGSSVTASGLFPSLNTNPSIRFDLKDGFLYSRENRGAAVTVKDSTNIIPSMRFEYTYIPKPVGVSNTGSLTDSYQDEDMNDRYDIMIGGFVHDDIIAFADNYTEYKFWALTMGGFKKTSMGDEYLAAYIGDAHGQLILVRKSNTALLEKLQKKESKGLADKQALASAAESHLFTRPEIDRFKGGQQISNPQDYIVEFRSDVKIATNIDINNLK